MNAGLLVLHLWVRPVLLLGRLPVVPQRGEMHARLRGQHRVLLRPRHHRLPASTRDRTRNIIDSF